MRRMLPLILLQFCMQLFSLHSSADTSAALDILELNSSFTASSFLISTSSTFTLSFRPAVPAPLQQSTSSSRSDLFLAISFVFNSSLDYPVWVANRDISVSASTAYLILSASGDLLLLDPSISPITTPIWNSNTAGVGVVYAQLLDSGNLVLFNNRSEKVWQSFDYPTDTLLPNQVFSPDSKELTSNSGLGYLHSGQYSMNFAQVRTVLAQQEAFVNVETYSGVQLDHLDRFRFDNSGNVTFFSSESSEATSSRSVVTSDYGVNGKRRMTLDVDGNMRLYTWDADDAQWSGVWILYWDVCSAHPTVCGSYGVCTYNLTPICICPQGFSVVNQTNLTSGCVPSYEMGKNCSSDGFKLVEMENVRFYANESQGPSVLLIEDCKAECLASCRCLAAEYNTLSGSCLLIMRVGSGYVPMNQEYRYFLKISSSDPLVSSPIVSTAATWSSLPLWQPPNPLIQPTITTIVDEKYTGQVRILAILNAIEGICFAAIVAGLFTMFRRQLKSAALRHEELEGCSPLVYSYEELRIATKDFRYKLGEGGFGTVYKGRLQNQEFVAVKRLEGMLQQEKQFRAEIVTIGRIHHINLLRLLGFCSEGNHRLLVYEYMEKGSLDQYLFQDDGRACKQIEGVLDWSTRFSICLGVARGIHYLHEECLNCILHCDIKPQNILLDQSFHAKVADFGLAYLHNRDHTVKVTTVRGTRGYLAPEWVSNLPITAKADIYSYGMLIMEVVSGRSNFLHSQPGRLADDSNTWCFPMWAYGKGIEQVVDARLLASSIDWKQVDMVLKVAFCCIQVDMKARPTMRQVLQILEGVLPVPDAPPPSLYCVEAREGSVITSPLA